MAVVEIPLLIIDVISSCNLECKHCLNRPKYQYKKTLSYEQVKICVERCLPHNVEKVCLSGGEPFMHPEIFTIIKNFTCDFPGIELVIATNGILLDHKAIEKLDAIGNITLQLSVDGSNKVIYESIRGENIYEKFMNTLNTISTSRNIKRTARSCINALNYKDTVNIYELCVQHNIEPSFTLVSNDGNARTNWDSLSLTPAQQLFVIDKINYMNKKYNLTVPSPVPCYKCNFTTLALRDSLEDLDKWGLCVNTDGNVSCCQALYDHPIGNIFSNTVIEMFEGTIFRKYIDIARMRYDQLKTDSSCSSCKLMNSCEFGCIGLAESIGDIYNLDQNCRYRHVFALSKAMNFIN